MDCNTCKAQLVPMMGTIPEAWREKISEALCNATPRTASRPETITSLSDWTIEDKQVCITYKDELLKEWKRCFDVSEFFDTYWDGIAPKLVATQAVWDSLNHLGRFNAIISRVCNTCAPVPFDFYYGFADDVDISEAEILAGIKASAMEEDDLTADFTSNTEPKYLWMAEPDTEPVKTGWFATELNKGGIGDTNLFASPRIVGQFRLYITQYKTQNTENTIKFLW